MRVRTLTSTLIQEERMGFWADSSPIVKGAIVVGILGVLVFGWMLLGLPPFGSDATSEVTQQRGLPAAGQ